MANQFRCAYATDKYEATVKFYRDGLGLEVDESWDRSDTDKGTLFKAASGIIEVVKRSADESHGEWENHRPQGFTIVIETVDVDELYETLSGRGLNITEGLRNQKWGHRSFRLADPNGVSLYFFSEIETKDNDHDKNK
jgi:uncharacterized glyoxalase superfamily protein PhnB